MKTCLTLISLSLLWLSPTHTGYAALTPAPTSTNTTPGSLVSSAQVETATAVGTINSSGNAKVTLTSADIDNGTPLVLLVPVAYSDISSIWADEVRNALSNDLQVAELFEVGGTNSTITLTRKAQLVGDGVSYYAANDPTLNLALENDTAVGITTATISEDTIDGVPVGSTAQVETATADGTISTAGNAKVIVTAEGLSGSPKAYPVAVAATDTASSWATKVRTALSADSNLTSLYSVAGSGVSITLTRKKVAIFSGVDIFAANDPSLNININNDTCQGIIPQTTSVNTTAGSLQNVGQVETATALGSVTTNGTVEVVVTSEALVGSPKKILVPVSAGDSTLIWAAKVRAALNADAAISSRFTVSGTNSKIILSRKPDIVSPGSGLSIYPDNDPTLNLAFSTGCKGIIPKLTSTNTTAGVLASTAQVETATAAGTISVSGSLGVVVTAAGLPGPSKSINVPVLVGDTASDWASKVRTAFNADSDISNLFAVGGAGDTVILTSKQVTTLDGINLYADNDPTLNIALVIDSDGDTLSDFDEIHYHLTDPANYDSDDDGFDDGSEIAALKNPLDPASKPASLIKVHQVPNPRAEMQPISITTDYSPFGHRPNTDKTSEDGSVAIRDQNGVIIWTDNRGSAVPLLNSALAKTLYVSNSECVVWQNRFDGSFNESGSESQIVVYRRVSDGKVSSSPLITVNGTLLETSPVSPSTYGFTLVAASRFDNGNESRQRYQSGTTSDGPNYAIRDVDQWDGQSLTLYRITWDNQLQVLSKTTQNIPKSPDNLGSIQVLGNGSDGSFFFKSTIARDIYDDIDSLGAGDLPGFFRTKTANIWVTTTQDKEHIFPLGEWTKPTISAPYVTNNRIILETQIVDLATEIPTGAVQLRDVRIQTNGSLSEAAPQNLDAGDSVLPVSNYTRAGLPVFIYTIDAANTSIKLYQMEDQLKRLGAAVTLPAPIVRGNDYVRDPRDASLLIKIDGAGLVWIPASKSWQTGNLIGLARPRVLPDSAKAMPLFVSSTEAVGWMNAAAPVDIPNFGVVPIAQLSHFVIDSGDTFVTTNLVPPIDGRYVALTPSLSPDAETEGWYISTFKKESTLSASMRTYRLRTVTDADEDADGLLDMEEAALLTEADNPDTDGDKISDGKELYPFYLVSGSFTYEQARMEAIRRGGRLAVLDTTEKRVAIERLFGNLPIGMQYWLGGGDMDGPKDAAGAREGQYRWMDEAGGFFDDAGDPIPGLTSIDISLPSGLFAIGQPNNNGNADGLVLRQDYKWAMAPITRSYGYIFEYRPSNPKLADSDSDLFTDLEEYELGTHPKNTDTDGDSISDYLEIRGFKWDGAVFVLNTADGFISNPLLKDTDGDGLNDDVESKLPLPTIPSIADSDSDGLTDSEEVNGYVVAGTTYTSNPLESDSDGDGFTDYEELTSSSTTDPNDSTSRPQPGQLSPPNPNMHDQAQLVRDQKDITIPSTYSPFGNRTDYNRFGDDGSAILLDVNGVLLWQDAEGRVLPIPQSEFAIPLIVSKNEAIVWTNALDPARSLGSDDADSDSRKIKLALYRRDTITDQIGEPNIITVEGIDILPTAVITPNAQAYTLVTFNHFGDPASGPDGTYAYVYRLTFAGNVQLLSTKVIPNTDGGIDAIQKVRALGHGSDGSILFSIDANAWFTYDIRPNIDRYVSNDPSQNNNDLLNPAWFRDRLTTHRRIYAVNGTLSEPTGVIQELSAATRITNLGDGGLPARAFYTSATRVVYQTVENGQMKDARLNSTNGALFSDSNFATPVGIGSILRSTTQTCEGDIRWLYTTTTDGLKLRVYRLINTGLELAYEAALPTGYVLDSAAFVSKINPADGSAVISPNNADMLWVFDNKNPGVPNAVRVAKTTNARAMFVERNELVLWGNARDAINSNGSMTDVQVRHYEQKNGSIVNPTNAYTNISAKILGRFVLDTLTFTPDFSKWIFSTVEKSSPSSTCIRRYKLVRYKDLDSDADGLPDIIEVQATLGTSPLNSDTDGDSTNDGDEFYPFEVINGSFTWEEAKRDAIARGGRLAVIQNRDDYTAIINRFKSSIFYDLWLGASDKVTEGTWKWENGISLNNTEWLRASPVASWADYYSGTSVIRVPWATGKPNNFNNSDGLIMNSNGSFEDRPLSTKLGYLCEYLRKDTDGDSLSDYTENCVLFSEKDPISNFMSPSVDLTNPNGNYEGLLYSEDYGMAGRIKITVSGNSAARAFSGTYEDIYGSKQSIIGTFNVDGSLKTNSTDLEFGNESLNMVLQKQNIKYHLHVLIDSPVGGLLFAKLRPALSAYAPLSPKLTFEAPYPSGYQGPTGTVIATGTVTNKALANFAIYMPDGSTATYAGSVLDGNIVALYAKSQNGLSLLGNLIIDNLAGSLDNISGLTRLTTDEYDQPRQLFGAYYSPPSSSSLPIKGFASGVNNTVFKWSDGILANDYQVVSWSPRGITPPKTAYDSMNATFTSSTGLMKLDYTRSDATKNLNATQIKAYAVVNQAQKTANGFYFGSDSLGGFNVTSNIDRLTVPSIVAVPNTPPPTGPSSLFVPGSVSSISPSSKQVNSAQTSYTIRVAGVNNWRIIVPTSSASWITTSIANDDGIIYTPSPTLVGSGNATVTVTIAANTTNQKRSGSITIGNMSHTVTQAEDGTVFVQGSVSSISLSSKDVRAAQQSYTIRVTGVDNWKITVPTSSAGWISASIVNDDGTIYTPSPTLVGRGNATVTVTIAANATNARRSGSITIGNKTHAVNQAYR